VVREAALCVDPDDVVGAALPRHDAEAQWRAAVEVERLFAARRFAQVEHKRAVNQHSARRRNALRNAM
jgi:hypothetical protein